MSNATVEYRDNPPDPLEFAGLFETTGWNDRYRVNSEELSRVLSASWSIVSAYVSDRLVGFGRAMSDGVLYAVLFDVIVHPDFQRRGIGAEIVKRLVSRCVAVGIRDIQLFSAAGKSEFYERLGFRVRPFDAPGMKFHGARAESTSTGSSAGFNADGDRLNVSGDRSNVTEKSYNSGQNTFRLYGDLAWLWPFWGDPAEEYADYCGQVALLMRAHAQKPVRSLLNIGCGGGKNVFNLKKHYDVVGIDLSPAMLELAKKLNPECEFLQGDMRTFSLGRRFDAILMDDGISYMASREDLQAAFRVASEHLNPGGVMIVGPDNTTETFFQNRTVATTAVGSARPDNVEVIFVENDYDPDPTDDHYEGTMIYLIREDGKLRVETDRHTLGLFPLQVWREALMSAGFVIREEEYVEDGRAHVTFACVKAIGEAQCQQKT
jgi:SAM-dependent methyltransferase/GNAT superfamily N-acetyltransferase